MAFTVEDGNGLPEANAYIEVAFADEYFADRGITAWTGAPEAKQAAIIAATDYIDKNHRFKGQRANVSCPSDETVDQALEFPRANGNDLPIPLPRVLKQACAEYALRALSASLQPDPEVDASGLEIASKSETVGPIQEQITYVNSGGYRITQPYPAADQLLRSLIITGSQVIRG